MKLDPQGWPLRVVLVTLVAVLVVGYGLEQVADGPAWWWIVRIPLGIVYLALGVSVAGHLMEGRREDR